MLGDISDNNEPRSLRWFGCDSQSNSQSSKSKASRLDCVLDLCKEEVKRRSVVLKVFS